MSLFSKAISSFLTECVDVEVDRDKVEEKAVEDEVVPPAAEPRSTRDPKVDIEEEIAAPATSRSVYSSSGVIGVTRNRLI